MKITTSYPVVIDGVDKTPDLYYDSADGEFSEARGRKRGLGKKIKAKRTSKVRQVPLKRPNRPVSLKGTRVITLGTKQNNVLKALDRPEFYNADGNDEYYDADGGGLKVFTTYPVTINKNRISPTDYFLNADGEEYLPFDGQTELLGFRDELGEEYFCGIDGEEFYNAKGEKLKGFFKKVGGGVVKAGKFIGKVAKKVGRAIVKASKSVVKGVKTAGGKVKAGAKKLIHHKTPEEKAKSKGDRDKKRADRVKEHNDKKAKRDKEIADAKAKGQTPPPPLPPLPPQTPQEKEGESPDAKGGDVFTKELPQATPNTPPENVVDVNGVKYDATDIPKDKEIVETIDESGKKIAGVEFKPEEVVAVTGKDGNIEYYTPDAQGMSKGLKIALVVGGAVVLLAVAYFIFRPKGKTSS